MKAVLARVLAAMEKCGKRMQWFEVETIKKMYS